MPSNANRIIMTRSARSRFCKVGDRNSTITIEIVAKRFSTTCKIDFIGTKIPGSFIIN